MARAGAATPFAYSVAIAYPVTDLLLTVMVIAMATLIRPDARRRFVAGSAGAYSLTPAAWCELTRAWARTGAEAREACGAAGAGSPDR